VSSQCGDVALPLREPAQPQYFSNNSCRGDRSGVIASVVAGLAAGALVSFPASLLIPLLLLTGATVLFYIWA